MRIAVGCDHAGFPFKAAVVAALGEAGHGIEDLGTWSTDPADYPDYARLVGTAVRDGHADLGVLICGSGAGVSIAANKIRGVRAALCHDLFTARQAREDDDANVLCLGARVIDPEAAIALARAFVDARFSHQPRHERRLTKILDLESAELGRVEANVNDALDVMRVPAVLEAAARLTRLEAARRLWQKDAGLWSDDPAVRATIVNRLGWLDAPHGMRQRVDELHAFAAAVRADGITDVVLLGMGGSSLAAEVLARTFGSAPGSPTLTVLDTTDPGAVRAVRSRLKLPQTVFIVASKSGTTTEMLVLYRFFRAEMDAEAERPGSHFVAITDAGTPLERLAVEGGFRHAFINAADIGGRFSALSYFGLVPAALVGIEPAALLDRALAMAAACEASAVGENPGLSLGAVLGGLATTGRDKVTLVLSEGLASLGAWLEQLLTESTGKQGRGLVVVDGEPLALPARYASDRVFVSLALVDEARPEHALAALAAAGHPVVRLAVPDRFGLGAEFFRWEVATAAVGAVLALNPFDEPNVSQAKAATQTALATFREHGRLPEWPVDTVEEAARTLRQAKPGDYAGVLAYLTPEPATTAALQGLRALIRDRTQLATTVGYGPRYLHSTGQLHKGGPATPILLMLTAPEADDVPIPGERYGFATLEMAQALGDLSTLRAAQRRVFWLPLEAATASAVESLAAALARLLA